MGWFGPGNQCGCCSCKCLGENHWVRNFQGDIVLQVEISGVPNSFPVTKTWRSYALAGQVSAVVTECTGYAQLNGTYTFAISRTKGGCFFPDESGLVMLQGSGGTTSLLSSIDIHTEETFYDSSTCEFIKFEESDGSFNAAINVFQTADTFDFGVGVVSNASAPNIHLVGNRNLFCALDFDPQAEDPQPTCHTESCGNTIWWKHNAPSPWLFTSPPCGIAVSDPSVVSSAGSLVAQIVGV